MQSIVSLEQMDAMSVSALKKLVEKSLCCIPIVLNLDEVVQH